MTNYKDLPLDNVFPFVLLTPISTAERDDLAAEEGMVIYNSDTQVLEFYNGTVWAAV